MSQRLLLCLTPVLLLTSLAVIFPPMNHENVWVFCFLPNLQLGVDLSQISGRRITIEPASFYKTPPVISTTMSPQPNAAGWNNSNVTISFTCSDETSGIAFCPSPVVVTTNGANQVITGTTKNHAGSTATASVRVNLDKTPPRISGTISPSPDVDGWNDSTVTVTFSCSDALSGMAICPSPISVATEGAGQIVKTTATDIAGNTATTSVTVNISFNFFSVRNYGGKCLDYRPAQRGIASAVFLNDCSAAHSVRVVEIPDRTDSQGNVFSHEVKLFAGKQVIGIHNPQVFSLGASSPPIPATEYALELQSQSGGITTLTNAANQIFRLDGDSIILEGISPCINTDSNLCPSPPRPQLVIQIKNARGANGSPLIVGLRNLADSEFWDFNAIDGSGRYPTKGFVSIATDFDLWNAVCATPKVKVGVEPPMIDDPMQSDDNTPLHISCSQAKGAWGTVLILSEQKKDCNPVPGPAPGQTQDIGACTDLSNYPPIFLPPGITLKGNRRGINFGPQLYFSFQSFWQALKARPEGNCLFASCMLEIHGDYVRISGLRLRGENRSTSQTAPPTGAIGVGWPGSVSGPLFPVSTTTEFISIIDHNDISDWGVAAVDVNGPYILNQDADLCSITFQGISNQFTQTCTNSIPNPSKKNSLTVADDPTTLANVHIARNFLHHNERDSGGYGVVTSEGGRAFIEGNTFLLNRHAIASDGEPHNEYRASYNLVLSNAPEYESSFLHHYYNQDFDMHGTNGGYGDVGGFYVDILGNTFLGSDRQNYWLRGQPSFKTDFHGNVSLQNQGDAVQFHYCSPGTLFCGNSTFPINIFDNQFADSTQNYLDPTTRLGPASLGVGDFDGDGTDDLFLATGAAWYFSPAGAREWRFLSSKKDTIEQLLLGDFDGDGRTDVVAMHSGQLVISWGGISNWEILNANPCPSPIRSCGISDMSVGRFFDRPRGDKSEDLFLADGTNWYLSPRGSSPFTFANTSSFRRKDLLFGDFNGDGKTDVFGVVSNGSFNTWSYSKSATGSWQDGYLRKALTNTVSGLIVADFNGDGIADVWTDCGADTPGCWRISYRGFEDWRTFTFGSSGPYVAGVGRFLGHVESDLLSWHNPDFWISVGGIYAPAPYSTQDMH
jgi:hypothetical protein